LAQLKAVQTVPWLQCPNKNVSSNRLNIILVILYYMINYSATSNNIKLAH